MVDSLPSCCICNYLLAIDVTVAKDGQEAFELVKQSMAERKLFNLIFMDVQVYFLYFQS